MNTRDKRIKKHIQRFVEAHAAHEAQPSADSWFELGCLLADAYEEQRACGEEAVTAVGQSYERFTPWFCWEQCVQLAPRHPQAWLRLGRCYLENELETDAKRCFAEAVAIDPSLVEAWVGLGTIALPFADADPTPDMLAAAQEAEEHFKRAVDLDADRAAFFDVYNLLAESALRRSDEQLALHWYVEGAAQGDSYSQRMQKKLAKALAKKQK